MHQIQRMPHQPRRSRSVRDRCVRLLRGNPGVHATTWRNRVGDSLGSPYPPCPTNGSDPSYTIQPRVNVSVCLPSVYVSHGIKAIATTRAGSIVRKVSAPDRSVGSVKVEPLGLPWLSARRSSDRKRSVLAEGDLRRGTGDRAEGIVQ